jgi:TRAP-type mannitol/chloroaromatic compound transport system permease small subunit
MAALTGLLRALNDLVDWIGKIVSFLVYPMIFVLVWEVLQRYVFNHPTIWAHQLSAMLFAVYFLLGGAYVSRWGAHINVEILYVRLPLRVRALLDLFTWSMYYLFLGVMFWLGIGFAWDSIKVMEVASTAAWEAYIWPVKVFVPLSALLMLIMGISKTLSDLIVLITGIPPETSPAGEIEKAKAKL